MVVTNRETDMHNIWQWNSGNNSTLCMWRGLITTMTQAEHRPATVHQLWSEWQLKKLTASASAGQHEARRRHSRHCNNKQVCVQPHQLGCQHNTACTCCWTPCCGAVDAGRRRLKLSIDKGTQQEQSATHHGGSRTTGQMPDAHTMQAVSTTNCYSNGSKQLHCCHCTDWSIVFTSWRQSHVIMVPLAHTSLPPQITSRSVQPF